MITKSKVRKIEPYLVPGLKSFRLVSPELTSTIKEKLQINTYTDGDRFLPLVVGPVSRFNANGGWLLLRDRPKEVRYVMTTHWELTDWQGEHHEGDSDVYRECYQRKRILPPSEELVLVNNRVYSNVLDETDKERIKHVINLMLELFGECDFAQQDFSQIINIRQKNFKLLPPGEYPFERVQHLIGANHQENRAFRFLKDRFEFFRKANPTTLIIGCGGYCGYVGFQYNQFLILDNIRYGNAIYVFTADSGNLLSYTKKEILDGKLHIARILHTQDWQQNIESYLK